MAGESTERRDRWGEAGGEVEGDEALPDDSSGRLRERAPSR
jgi:hypothetical protein